MCVCVYVRAVDGSDGSGTGFGPHSPGRVGTGTQTITRPAGREQVKPKKHGSGTGKNTGKTSASKICHICQIVWSNVSKIGQIFEYKSLTEESQQVYICSRLS